MDEHKIPQEEEKRQSEQEEYSFMQEVIKDEADSKKKIKLGAGKALGYGVLFGIAASAVFCVIEPWVEEHFQGKPSQVEIPADEEEVADDIEEQDVKVATGEDYQQMLEKLGQAASDARKSMVTVRVSKKKSGKKTSEDETSGIIVADNGQQFVILAESLECKDDETIEVTFADHANYQAEQKVEDGNLNLAIYTVNRHDVSSQTIASVESIAFGSSSSIEQNDTVIAIGKPYGTDDAFGYGVVIGNESSVELADGQYQLLQTSIQGNTQGSGAILNRYGKLIGIICPSQEEDNSYVQAYAISGMKDIIECMSNGEEIPYAGIIGTTVTEDMKESGVPEGIYVKEVEADSPAMQAGIQSGDVITSMDGTTLLDWSSYHGALMKKQVGDTMKLQGCRQGSGDDIVDIDFEVTVESKSND